MKHHAWLLAHCATPLWFIVRDIQRGVLSTVGMLALAGLVGAIILYQREPARVGTSPTSDDQATPVSLSVSRKLKMHHYPRP